MKERNYKKTEKKSYSWDYPTNGNMEFTCSGYVQSIKEGDNVDYCTFYLDNPFVSNNVNSFDITVPWENLPQLEVGDHVNIFGLCRSWWNKDLSRVLYSFVAQQIEVIEDPKEEEPEMPVKKSRRGTAKPV